MDDSARATALMLADLGVEHRDAVSAPLEGMSARAAAQYEAEVQAENRARRERIIRGAPGVDQNLHSVLTRWNTPQSFGGDDTAEDLQNRYDGQGHRHQLNQRVSQHSDRGRDFQENRFDNTSMNRGRPPPHAAQRQTLGSMNINANPSRQRAPSPRASGTVRFPPTRQGVAPLAASMAQHNGIPNIGTNLASAVQARSTAGNLTARTPALPSTTTSAARAPRHIPEVPAPSPLPRPASPALSAASSTSTSAVAMAQAAMKARFEAMQKAKSATPAPSPELEAASTSNISAHAGSPAVGTLISNESAENASTETSGDLNSKWPGFGPTAGASSNRKSPAVADAQATIRDHIDGQRGGLTPQPRVTASDQISIPTRTTTPNLAVRQAVTGAVNGAVPRMSGPSTTQSTSLVPRGRATATVSNTTTTNGVLSDVSAPRSSVANGLLSLPAAATSTVPSAPRSSIVQATNGSAAVVGASNESIIIRAKIDARREPEHLNDIKKFYMKYPERRPAFDQARKRIVRKVVEFAAVGDMAAAKKNAEHLDPSADWLIEAAFAAWSGAMPENADHPTIKEIVAAVKAAKQQMEEPTKVEERMIDAKQSVATPATQPVPSNTSDSTNSSATAESNSTAVSTPTPPRTVMGMLTTTFFSAAGRFLANKEFPLSEPVTVHIAVTTKADEFDPLKLADDMEVLAKKYSNPAATV